MALFQKTVEQKYLKQLNSELINAKYLEFKTYFGNTDIQENIRNSKEEQFQEGFFRELFVNILGYTLNPTPNFNLTTEYKNIKDSKKADGVILSRGHAPLMNGHAPLVHDQASLINNQASLINNQAPLVVAVIELKGTNTTDLSKIEAQAFGYKNNQPNCIYVITSNFEKLRFYIDNAIEHIEFNLFTLSQSDFEILYLCLSSESIEKGIPKKIKEESLSQEDVITKKLYKDYSLFKRELHQSLVLLNSQYDSLTLFKKSQKLLDRFLFLFFAEDRNLLPPNSVRLILTDWRDLQERDVEIPLYDRFKKYFGYLNTGYKGKRYDVFAYNGGLFKSDEVLDHIIIDDELLFKHTFKLSEYDFASEVDVNILGHIFENSLNDLDEFDELATIEQTTEEQAPSGGNVSRRKKDGVFYTPKYITKYIVENTIGKLCSEKKAELQFIEEEYTTDKKRQLKTKQALLEKLKTYQSWLLQLTICDPACGSGAFLNQALDFLLTEHQYIDELQAKLLGVPMVFSDIEKSILENNLFGVDLNDESVEIAKLSLWLRTAQPNRKLNDLNHNIKCGNSLIDDPAVAGNKAFNWQREFPQVFHHKEKKGWHITCATHNSRYSQRMLDHHVEWGDPVWLSEKEEILIIETIAKIAKADHLNIIACNICGDHLHLLLVCEEAQVPKIVGKLKSISARECNIAMGRTIPTDKDRTKGHALSSTTSQDASSTRGTAQAHLWTQKFGKKEITTTEQLENTIAYIRNNRVKHGLPELGNGSRTSTTRAANSSKGSSRADNILTENSSTDTRGSIYTGNSNADNNSTGVSNTGSDKGAYPLVRVSSDFSSDSSILSSSETSIGSSFDNSFVLSSDIPPVPSSDFSSVPSSDSSIDTFRVSSSVSSGSDIGSVLENICCSTEHAFRTEYTGGFDVVIGNPPYVQLQSMGEMSESLKNCRYETFDKGADLYCIFTERGYQLLNKGGIQSFIMPNKWMLVAYGKPLRKFLSKTGLQQVLNFGDIQFFQGAATIVCIFVTQKGEPKENVKVLSLNKKTYYGDFMTEVESNLYNDSSSKFGETEWSIQPYNDSRKLEQMKQNGTELKDLSVSINYGIKTGFNDAFFIDEKTRQKLIADDARSLEIIKPMVRGRDISAYGITGSEFLINVHNGLKEKNPPLLPIRIDDYPAIMKHLDNFFPILQKRGDKGITPYNLRNCAYYEEFAKPKIIYPNMTSVFPFMYDESGLFGNDKTFILTAQDDSVSLLFLTALFNSSLAKLWIWYNCPELQGGTREIRKVYFEHFPVPQANEEQTAILVQFATKRTQLTADLKSLSAKFQRTLIRKFPILSPDDLSGELVPSNTLPAKLQDWYMLTYAQFIKELAKKKIKLSLSDEAEWEDYFIQEQNKTLEIKSQIDSTDREIDQMVYTLYGLSEAEINIGEKR